MFLQIFLYLLEQTPFELHSVDWTIVTTMMVMSKTNECVDLMDKDKVEQLVQDDRLKRYLDHKAGGMHKQKRRRLLSPPRSRARTRTRSPITNPPKGQALKTNPAGISALKAHDWEPCKQIVDSICEGFAGGRTSEMLAKKVFLHVDNHIPRQRRPCNKKYPHHV